jgi:hypothetical protein
MRLVGHVAFMGGKKNAHKFLSENLKENTINI